MEQMTQGSSFTTARSRAPTTACRHHPTSTTRLLSYGQLFERNTKQVACRSPLPAMASLALPAAWLTLCAALLAAWPTGSTVLCLTALRAWPALCPAASTASSASAAACFTAPCGKNATCKGKVLIDSCFELYGAQGLARLLHSLLSLSGSVLCGILQQNAIHKGRGVS